MDFIRQLVCFHRKATGNLTPNAIAIYLYLFMENNDCGWADWFEASDYWMGQAVGIKRRETIIAALNLLKQRGFVDFQRGTQRNKPSRYKLLPLFNSAKDSAKPSAKDSAKPSAKTVPKDSAKDVFLPYNQNLKDKGKERGDARARANPKTTPPTLDDVNDYVMERHLHVSARKFYDYYEAGDWKDAKGNPIRNWKQKLLTWEAHEPKGNLCTNKSQVIHRTQAEENLEAADRAIAFFEQEAMQAE